MCVFKLVNSEGHLGRSSTPKTYSKPVDTRRRIDVKTFKRGRVSTGNFINRLEGEKISFQDETEETFLMTMIHVVKINMATSQYQFSCCENSFRTYPCMYL